VIVEVTPQQAEFVTFIQDQHQSYQLIVRAKDDHSIATTTGITYSVLATDPTWDLPWPTTITAPLDQTTGAQDDTGDTSTTTEGTGDSGTPVATPEADGQ
jgi:hypothetical protein